MELDFENSDNVTDFISVPPGTYLCRVAEVREGKTRNDDVRWSLRLVVVEGEFTGRFASFDSLIFSKRGLARVRKVLAALGLPHKGRVELTPEDIEGRQAFVEVRPSEYLSPSGETIKQNEVPYDGYRSVPEDADPGDAAAPRGARLPAGGGRGKEDDEDFADIPF